MQSVSAALAFFDTPIELEAKMNWKYCHLSLALWCVTLIGCGSGSGFPKTYPVTGKVTLNGKAIEGAMVTFQLAEGKENAIGSTDASGEFKLSMFQPSDGAIPGQYRVAIRKVPPGELTAPANTPPPGTLASGDLPADYAPPAPTEGSSKVKQAKSEVPEKYGNDQASGLRATVTEAGPNRFEFDLK